MRQDDQALTGNEVDLNTNCILNINLTLDILFKKKLIRNRGNKIE